MSMKSRGTAGGEFGKNVMSRNLAFLLCLGSFCAGMLFTNRLWILPGTKGNVNTSRREDAQISLKFEDGDSELVRYSGDESIRVPDKKTSELEMKATIARMGHESVMDDFPISGNLKKFETNKKRKYFMVIGINTAFNSRKRRDSVRATWMPRGDKRKKLEEEKGIVIRFVIGHSSTPGGVLDKAIEAEETLHGDFLQLDHVEGYMELSAKTKTYFSTAVALWDAEFFIKVDDDVHVNLATLGTTLSRHRLKPRRYIGCMKSGPVLSRKGVKYHEPEYWKFGTVGNNYFRHASGQIYAISRDLAAFISINRHVLHNYANEDVSLGSWLIGLDVVHVDDRRLCCGTPPDCEWKAQAGNVCGASFDWKCSGICNSVERIVDVHQRCGEHENALQRASF